MTTSRMFPQSGPAMKHGFGKSSLAVLGVLAALALGTAGAHAQSGDVVKVSERGAFSNAPVYVADKQGFFAEEGVKVQTIVLGGQSDTLTAALVNGDIDVLPQNPVAFAAAATKVDMKYFLGIQRDDIELVVKASDDKVPDAAKAGWEATVKALKGYRLGSATRGSVTFAKLAIMLNDVGYAAGSDYQVVVSGIVNQSIAAMQADQVDAFITDSFGARLAEQQGVGKSVLVWATDRPQQYPVGIQTALAARAKSLTEQGDLYTRFSRALIKADAWIKDPANQQAFASLIQDQYKLDEKSAATLAQRTRETGVFDSKLDPALFDATMSILQKGGTKLPDGTPSYEEGLVKLQLPGIYE